MDHVNRESEIDLTGEVFEAQPGYSLFAGGGGGLGSTLQTPGGRVFRWAMTVRVETKAERQLILVGPRLRSAHVETRVRSGPYSRWPRSSRLRQRSPTTWAGAAPRPTASPSGPASPSARSYQYFPNKEAILARLVEKHRESVHAVVDGGLTRLDDLSIPVESSLRRLFEDLVELHLEDPVLTRVLSTAAPHFPVGQDHEAESEHLICRIQRVIEARSDLRVQRWRSEED